MTGKTVRVQISGQVQGVWFRGWAQQEATRLGLSGWIRNRVDGRVDALFSGVEDDVDQMLDLCWQGPGLAKVKSVEIEQDEPPEQGGFRVVRAPDD